MNSQVSDALSVGTVSYSDDTTTERKWISTCHQVNEVACRTEEQSSLDIQIKWREDERETTEGMNDKRSPTGRPDL